MTATRVELEVGGRTLSIETGKLAKQADGAAVVQFGETVVLGSDLHLPGVCLLNGLVGSAVAELELVRLRPQRQGGELVAEADPEDRLGLREFAPDWIIVLGPGDTLGGSIGQTLVELGWRGIDSKTGFMDIQASEPFVVSLGREEQRALAA